MKDPVKKILDLLEQGKITADEAADLLKALNAAESSSSTGNETPPPVEEHEPSETESRERATVEDDPFKTIGEAFRRLTTELDSGEVGQAARKAVSQAVKGLRETASQIKKGRISFDLFSATERKAFEMDFAVDPAKTLRIVNPKGDVKVIGGSDAAAVSIDAVIRGATPEDARTKAESYTLVIEESDHHVVIRQPEITGLSADLEVRIPAANMVDVQVTSGDIRLDGTGGGAKVQSESGDVEIRGLEGLIEVSSTSGDVFVVETASPMLSIENRSGNVVLRDLVGNVRLSTASGDVNIRGLDSKSVSIDSVSGDVFADFRSPLAGVVNVRTVNGSAVIHVPDGSDCRVALSTLRGDVISDVELEGEARADRRITGQLGEGAGVLDVSAVNGDVALRYHNQDFDIEA